MLRLRRHYDTWRIVSDAVPGLVVGTVNDRDAATRIDAMEALVALLGRVRLEEGHDRASGCGTINMDMNSFKELKELLSQLG